MDAGLPESAAMNLRQELEAFRSDGCTGFFDVWRNIDIFPCCFNHDMTWYLNPGNWGVWLQSNIDLGFCFGAAGAVELVLPAITATCTIGALLFAGWSAKAKKRAT